MWTFSPTVAAELAWLSEALDQPGVDLTQGLRQLSDAVALAVESYLGMTVRISVVRETINLTTLQEDIRPIEIVSSLMLSPADARRAGEPTIALVLYAGQVGAFNALAADVTRQPHMSPLDLVLDQHLAVPAEAGGLARVAVISQAIGVLLARGLSPEQALDAVDATAARADVDRRGAAELLLAQTHNTTTGATDPDPA